MIRTIVNELKETVVGFAEVPIYYDSILCDTFGGFYYTTGDYMIDQVLQMYQLPELFRSDIEFAVQFGIHLSSDYKDAIDLLDACEALDVLKRTLANGINIRTEAVTDKLLMTFLVLHEFGHYIDHMNNGTAFLQQFAIQSAAISDFAAQGHTSEEIQERYRKLPLEIQADEYAIAILKSII